MVFRKCCKGQIKFSRLHVGAVPVQRLSCPHVLVTSPPKIMYPSKHRCRATVLKLLLASPRIGNESISPFIKGASGWHSTAASWIEISYSMTARVPTGWNLRMQRALSFPIQLPSIQWRNFCPRKINPVWQASSKVFWFFSSSRNRVWLIREAKAGWSGTPQLKGVSSEWKNNGVKVKLV